MCDGRILLYNTENITSSSEKFDCIYVTDNVDSDHGGSSAGKIPYCQRITNVADHRKAINKCENGGEMRAFIDLLEENVRPFEVLKWSSSVEMADNYAAFYYNNYSATKSNETEDFLCQCNQSNVFGKFCEYQLTHEANSFEASQISQAINRTTYLYHNQLYSDILCYRTLSCNSGLLCLDWRNICNGDQECEDGWDEENCDKLEFNECDEGEFRCINGMCIPEEYWLDGDKDCMDWSDENFPDIFSIWCFEKPTTIDCDEHVCLYKMWSCGDGQCIIWKDRLIFQNLVKPEFGCYSLRHMAHMCELNSLRRAWTLPNGLCWILNSRYDDRRLSMNNVVLTNNTKCIYLIRCALSDGLELDCPCNRFNCSGIMRNVCEDRPYLYPPSPLIRPYVFMLYDWTLVLKNQMPHMFILIGNLRCRGYHGSLRSPERLELWKILVTNSYWETLPCLISTTIKNDSSPMKYDGDCWKGSLTFSGRPYAIYDVCQISQQCISQYRINDGWSDCVSKEDEEYFDKNETLCSRVRKHRFRCSITQPTCFTTSALAADASLCSNNYDRYLYGYNRSVKEITCRKSDSANCQLFKEYIKNSSLTFNSTSNLYLSIDQPQYQSRSRIPFRSYCDSFWNIPGHTDELPEYCRRWVCNRDQYQCRTGQCIPLNWVCDKQWDCADASDEEGMFAISQWSPHNQQLQGLEEKRQECLQHYFRLPFSQFCEAKTEFPCLRSNVSDPLNVTQYHPCIPYSKIGDDIEDCYNAYDEKNTLERQDGQMWGFALRCDNTSLHYLSACERSLDTCEKLLCFYQRDQTSTCSNPTDAVCIDDGRCIPTGRCDGERDCRYGEDEYWCGPDVYSEQVRYRYKKLKKKNYHRIFDQQKYPSFQLSTEISPVFPQSSLSNSKRIVRDAENPDIEFSFRCNKGVTVSMRDQKVCFCPPAYFGNKCQLFSDRITVVTHLDLTAWSSLLMTSKLLLSTIPKLFKIKANLLFNGNIIDHYEFYSYPTNEIHNRIKHKFYLLYSRSSQMLLHKKVRFLNRMDIETNHPYTVHFDLYALRDNHSTPIPLGSWHYPIYFDFLPSFRLATVLRFSHWFGNATLDPCANRSCNENSICKPIFNKNNSYTCACRSGFYGENCSRYENACSSYCSPNSFCEANDRSMMSQTNNPVCICSLEHFGSRCFLRFEQCNSKPCLNNGSCVYTYESYNDDSFVCICSELFYGDRCQHAKTAIHIRLNSSTMVESPRASTIQFYDVDNSSLVLMLQHQQVRGELPSYIDYAHDLVIAPVLCILKTHYDSIQTKYFIIYLQPNTPAVNVISSPEHCPFASSLLNKNDSPAVLDVFKYHHICRNDRRRLCFYDEDYLCICQWDNYRVDCFLHDTRIDHCDKCLSNGKCIQGNVDDSKDFLCLCPRCHQGRLCEFNMQAFGFTLDSLLVDCSRGIKLVYFSLVFLLFLVGFFNNLCSFLTFKRPVPRKVGVGNYLFLVSCLNQLSLICLFIKFIQITFDITDTPSCKSVSYTFSVVTKATYWLNSWITVDRLLIILYPTSVALKKPRLAIGISVITLLCLFSMHIHEVICYTIIRHLPTDSSICVTNFDTHFISLYNRITTLIHYLLPFFIQIIAVTLLIVLAARSRTKTSGGKINFRQVLIKQFHTQKELYVTPIIIILSALPQTILTFSLACIELSTWHRHILLIAYVFSYAPQVLGFILYVLPSTVYKQEFSETFLARRIFSLLINTKQRKTIVSKKK